MPELKTRNPLALRLLMTDDLYSVDDKIEKQGIPVEDEASESLSFNYLGENNKYMLILVNDSGQDIINPEDLATLTSILTAKQLELRDVAIVNVHTHPQKDFKQLKHFFACKKLVLFGINPSEIGLRDITSNQLEQYNETKILATYNFSEMRNDTAKKRLFWNAMKQL
jgi:hypothetical protein